MELQEAFDNFTEESKWCFLKFVSQLQIELLLLPES